jgi:hypothetical protein
LCYVLKFQEIFPALSRCYSGPGFLVSGTLHSLKGTIMNLSVQGSRDRAHIVKTHAGGS